MQSLDMVMMVASSSLGAATDVARTFGRVHPEVPIVIISNSESVDEVGCTFETGICGYVLKQVQGSELIRILMGISDGAA